MVTAAILQMRGAVTARLSHVNVAILRKQSTPKYEREHLDLLSQRLNLIGAQSEIPGVESATGSFALAGGLAAEAFAFVEADLDYFAHVRTPGVWSSTTRVRINPA
jgi:hypothetical protein